MTAKAAAAAVGKPAPSRAYVTFLAGDGDNWKVVVGLAKGLFKVGAAYPLVVAVLPDVPESHRRILVSHGCVVREIEPVYPPDNQTQFAMAYYAINYSKLRIWEFEEYERMVYLDPDILVLDNIDELFELKKGHLYAVIDCFCDRDKTWSHTPEYKAGYCHHQFFPDEVRVAVALPAGELGPPPPPLYFNAGMFVYEPGMATAKALLDTLRVTPPTPPFAEQGFLNMFFREQFRPIPPVYNLPPAMLLSHPENVQPEEVKVVRYCPDKEKSYMDREGIEMLKNKKGDIYNHEETLNFINCLPAMPADAGEVGKEKLPACGNWLVEAKDVIFAAGKNPPAVATMVASSAATGVVAAAATLAICFGFYAVFVAAMAVVIISLRRM
ncbi:unnamed protein product [Urochloa humidicola]